MTYLITLSVSVLLLASFIVLVYIETRRERRVFSRGREVLDAKVARLTFIFTNVNWGEFAGHITRTSIETAIHELAHRTLLLVRSIERSLTGVVRALRARRDGIVLPSVESGSRISRAKVFVRDTFHRTRHVGDSENSGDQ